MLRLVTLSVSGCGLKRCEAITKQGFGIKVDDGLMMGSGYEICIQNFVDQTNKV